MFARLPSVLLLLVVSAAMLLGAQSAWCFVDHVAAAPCVQAGGADPCNEESSAPGDDSNSSAPVSCCHAHAPLATLGGEAQRLAAPRFSFEGYAQREFPCPEGTIRKIDYPPQRC